MLFPKPTKKKKRRRHRESLLQNKESRICYLCAREGDNSWKSVLEEHHIFGGPNRHLSEEYGLKVYICPECHRTSARADTLQDYLCRAQARHAPFGDWSGKGDGNRAHAHSRVICAPA